MAVPPEVPPVVRDRQGIALAWSSGKDAAFALETLVRQGQRPRALFTTVIDGAVPMYRTDASVVRAQAAAVGLPVVTVELPQPFDRARYLELLDARMHAPPLDVDGVAFGDLHLTELRRRRERDLSVSGLRALFPVWASDALFTARAIVAAGIRAVICAVDTELAPAVLLGRPFDAEAIDVLRRAGADPCGEHGEIHTVVTDAPSFARPVALRETARETTDRFHAIRFEASGGRTGQSLDSIPEDVAPWST